MDGYESYLSGFRAAPEYKREVLYPNFGEPLNTILITRGVMVETEKHSAKILSAADGATSYKMTNGGIAEVMPEKYSGSAVIVTIPPEQVKKYRSYQAPLPFWAWSMG